MTCNWEALQNAPPATSISLVLFRGGFTFIYKNQKPNNHHLGVPNFCGFKGTPTENHLSVEASKKRQHTPRGVADRETKLPGSFFEPSLPSSATSGLGWSRPVPKRCVYKPGFVAFPVSLGRILFGERPVIDRFHVKFKSDAPSKNPASLQRQQERDHNTIQLDATVSHATFRRCRGTPSVCAT